MIDFAASCKIKCFLMEKLMKKRNLMIVLVIVLCMITGTACGAVSTGGKTTPVAAEVPLENINKGLMMADASLHDPAMAKGKMASIICTEVI